MNIIRPRRIRKNELIRNMVRETRISKNALVYPIFVREGSNIIEEIDSMKGQYRYSIDKMLFKLEQLSKKGIKSVLLFGIPNEKDDIGSGAWAENGIVQNAIIEAKKRFPNLYYITDVCMCEYTSHGHCGIVENGYVNNDKSVEVIAKTALSHVIAGADMVAPSDMMDGRVLGIRNLLDKNGYSDIPVMSYSAKYSSAFYGPFRDAAGSAPSFGDRKSYQMDYHNSKEALKEILLDINEGADIIMVKPALSYLDIIKEAYSKINIPLAAYSVSGEYSMIKAAGNLGYIDEDSVICETAVSIFRAGADILITYFAEEIAQFINEGRIG